MKHSLSLDLLVATSLAMGCVPTEKGGSRDTGAVADTGDSGDTGETHDTVVDTASHDTDSGGEDTGESLIGICKGLGYRPSADLELQKMAFKMATARTLCLEGESSCTAYEAYARSDIDSVFDGILTEEGSSQAEFEAGTAPTTLGVLVNEEASTGNFYSYLALGAGGNESDWAEWLSKFNDAGFLASLHPTTDSSVYAVGTLGSEGLAYQGDNNFSVDGGTETDGRAVISVIDWKSLGYGDSVYVIDDNYDRSDWTRDSAFDAFQADGRSMVCAAAFATEDIEPDSLGNRSVVLSYP